MKAEVQSHEFNQNLFFYDLVSSFSISLCGCPVIFEPDVEIYKKANQLISFPGAYSQAKHLAPFQLREQALKGEINKSKHIASCCMMLANTAYESVKQYNDRSEVFEFFRHIRNASSHLNNFQFNHKEPAHPAKWRGAVIEHHQKGEKNVLFGKPCFGHFIGVADLLDLLMDIEQKIILSLESSV
ncbi:hypothetical protein [Colwellia piezophila]|uniref:hypothetical protein n=1 Tax=Colwellia piezophila TaxID=211668 RepID=UPI00036BA42C|nr:hypothetical protein [Colwellia piezophila]